MYPHGNGYTYKIRGSQGGGVREKDMVEDEKIEQHSCECTSAMGPEVMSNVGTKILSILCSKVCACAVMLFIGARLMPIGMLQISRSHKTEFTHIITDIHIHSYTRPHTIFISIIQLHTIRRHSVMKRRVAPGCTNSMSAGLGPHKCRI